MAILIGEFFETRKELEWRVRQVPLQIDRKYEAIKHDGNGYRRDDDERDLERYRLERMDYCGTNGFFLGKCVENTSSGTRTVNLEALSGRLQDIRGDLPHAKVYLIENRIVGDLMDEELERRCWV